MAWNNGSLETPLYLSGLRLQLMAATLKAFRATLKLTWEDQSLDGDKIFSYWNNWATTSNQCDMEEVLHIIRRIDGTFYLQIANQLYEGKLEELEEILFEWARCEGWLKENAQT